LRTTTIRYVVAHAIELALAACSGGKQAEQAKDAPIRVETSQLSVLIENKAGLSLLDIKVTILPVGGLTEFTHSIGRMESAEKREFALGEFNGRDGTPLNLRVVRPKTVRVTAKDFVGKTYNIEVPWH
jgi:hypothetical protein